MHRNRQQCLVAEWLGVGNVFFPFFFSVLKVTNSFVLHISGNCDVRGVRITVRDVTMMYSQERHMENVPSLLSQFLLTPVL